MAHERGHGNFDFEIVPIVLHTKKTGEVYLKYVLYLDDDFSISG